MEVRKLGLCCKILSYIKHLVVTTFLKGHWCKKTREKKQELYVLKHSILLFLLNFVVIKVITLLKMLDSPFDTDSVDKCHHNMKSFKVTFHSSFQVSRSLGKENARELGNEYTFGKISLIPPSSIRKVDFFGADRHS